MPAAAHTSQSFNQLRGDDSSSQRIGSQRERFDLHSSLHGQGFLQQSGVPTMPRKKKQSRKKSPTHPERELRKQLAQLLRGGQAHVNFSDALEGFPAKKRGVLAKGPAAHGVAITGTRAHRAVGHPGIQPQSQTCFSGFSRRLLAQDAHSAESRGVGSQRPRISARPAPDDCFDRKSRKRSARRHCARAGENHSSRSPGPRRPQRISSRPACRLAPRTGNLARGVACFDSGRSLQRERKARKRTGHGSWRAVCWSR